MEDIIKNMTFTVIENNKQIIHNIIKYCTFENKTYLIYRKEDDENIYASEYKIINNELVLFEINTDKEWDFIDNELNKETF